MTPETALRAIAFIGGVGVTVSTLEYLYSYDRFDDEGLLSWRLSKFHRGWSQTGLRSKLADAVFRYDRFRWILLVRGIAGVSVVVAAVLGERVPFLFLLVFLTTYSITLRNSYGLDGAYQLTLVVFAALFVASFFPVDSTTSLLCVWFIGLQTLLSYFVSGVSKLWSESWRNGDALAGIFGTNIYGHSAVFRFLDDRPRLGTVMCWLTIVFECAFPIVLFVDVQIASLLIACGVLFHLSNAVFMGLNGFFVMFLSTYPALVYVSGSVTSFG
jgi:hypothetical protein